MTAQIGRPLILGHVHLPLTHSAEQIMSMPAFFAPPHGSCTPEEFYLLRDAAPATLRHELVDGELLVTPAPSRSHQAIIAKFVMELGPYVRAQRLGELLPAPFDVKLADSVILQPDLLVIPPDAPHNNRMTEISHIALAIEILSPGSARHDRITKRAKYQEYGVPEYWVVDPASRTIERWRPADARAELVSEAIVWEPHGVSMPFILELNSFFGDTPGPESD